MKHLAHSLTHSFLPVFLGLISASVTMVIVESMNAQFFPFPDGMDIYDLAAVQSFSATLPSAAFWVVIFGWALGSFLGGVVTTLLARRWGVSEAKTVQLVWTTGGILLALGILNSFVLLPGIHPVWFHVVSLPALLFGSYLGYWAVSKR